MELKREAKRARPGKPAHLGRVVKKAIVMGILERGQNGNPSQMRTEMIESHRRPHIQDVVRKNVEEGSNLMTDALRSYQGLGADFVHQSVNHAIRYALGNIHTNGVENYWSLLQRMLLGTYVAVEPFHLERYLDEQCARFNHRQDNDALRLARGRWLAWWEAVDVQRVDGKCRTNSRHRENGGRGRGKRKEAERARSLGYLLTFRLPLSNLDAL